MGAYGNMDAGIAGLKIGLEGRVEGGWACAEADGIGFGKPVFGYVGDAKKAYLFHNDVAKIVYSADFIASNSTVVTVDGVATTATVFATDHLTTINAILTKLNALTGVEAVLDSSDTNNRTILIRKKADDFVVASATTGGTSQPTTTITYGSSQVFVGVAMFTQKAASPNVTSNQGYEQYDSMNVMADGELMSAPVVAAVKANDEAYVDNSGAGLGDFSNAGVEVAARYRGNAAIGASAPVRVTGQKEMTYSNVF